MTTFPKQIYVTIEEAGLHEPDFLSVIEGGLDNIEEDQKAVATYQLVAVGKVEIKKRLVETKAT